LLYQAFKKGVFPTSPYLIWMVFIGIFSIIPAVLVGHGNMIVALYGSRILLIHFPLIFVMGSILDREDVIKMGKLVLWMAVPMTILIIMQFYSPQAAWVNRGIGGDLEGSGFGGALGYYRPSGIFSFTNGNTLYYGLLACFVMYFWFDHKKISKFILIASTAALLIAIPFSISRGLFFHFALSLFFAMMIIMRKPQYLGKMVFAIVGMVLVVVVVSKLGFFETGTEVFTARFEDANETEGGMDGVLMDRFLGGLYYALTSSVDQPFLGYGIGMGTNVGSMLLSGSLTFLITEGEWGRIVGELGPILGLSVIFIRLIMGLRIAMLSYKRMVQGQLLSWFLLSFGFLLLVQGEWGQPTALGFSIYMGGIMIASIFNRSKD
jgi:hypothetical protein